MPIKKDYNLQKHVNSSFSLQGIKFNQYDF